MFRRLLVLSMLFVFAISGSGFAGVATLPDKALDDVSAGDWVVLTDSSGNETVKDVYTTNNTLDLLQESQKDIQAVSNENAIDSATAVQTNVARVSSNNTPTSNVAVNGTNSADITNYRPAANTTESSKTVIATSTENTVSTGESLTKTDNFTLSSESSKKASTAAAEACSFAHNETENVSGSIAQSAIVVGKEIGLATLSGSLLVDKDKVISASKSSSSSSSAEESSKTLVNCIKSEASSKTSTETTKATTSESSESSKTTRDSKGVNNHIALLANAQQNIKAVSNLNAVGSGAAVQTNIASNVGVSGSITHVNSAAVSSGF